MYSWSHRLTAPQEETARVQPSEKWKKTQMAERNQDQTTLGSRPLEKTKKRKENQNCQRDVAVGAAGEATPPRHPSIVYRPDHGHCQYVGLCLCDATDFALEESVLPLQPCSAGVVERLR